LGSTSGRRASSQVRNRPRPVARPRDRSSIHPIHNPASLNPHVQNGFEPSHRRRIPARLHFSRIVGRGDARFLILLLKGLFANERLASRRTELAGDAGLRPLCLSSPGRPREQPLVNANSGRKHRPLNAGGTST
jgi:hypothetical protein